MKKISLLVLLGLLAGCTAAEEAGLPTPFASAEQAPNSTETSDPLAEDMTEAEETTDSEQGSGSENNEGSSQSDSGEESEPEESVASESDPDCAQSFSAPLRPSQRQGA